MSLSRPLRLLLLLLSLLGVSSSLAQADPPELSMWKLNLTGLTGYAGLPANVQQVRYSAGNVYINASSIPAYSIGPWPGNPNTPSNQNFLMRFPRNPVVNAGAKTSTPLGTIGLWTNGVSIYNALDARSYNNQNIWHNNAITVEGPSFDACLGHPAPGGNYHHHENASCLYGADPAMHSPLLGYAYDGFPVYGPYGYSDPNAPSAVTRIRSGYRLRSIAVRQTLADGTVLTPAQYGPAVGGLYPLGYFVEDYEFVGGLGDLDAYNGRVAVTPEYPGGIYAYFTTVDAQGVAVYPYHIGPKYYGVVANDNITSHGRVTISEAVSTYDPTLGVGESGGARTNVELAQNQPNPALARASIRYALPQSAHVSLALYDVTGHKVMTLVDGARGAGEQTVTFDTSRLAAGVYFYRLRAGSFAQSRHLLVVH